MAQEIPSLKQLTKDQLETVIDRFETDEFMQGDEVVREGDTLNKLYIVKMGELECVRKDGA